MKNLAIISATIITALLSLSGGVSVQAQENIFQKGCEGAQNSTLCQNTGSNSDPFFSTDGLFADILQFITILVGIAAVIMVIIGGLQYVMSGGDPAKVSSAKNTLLFAVIGIVVVLLAQALVLFVVRRI